ncbi:histidine phosphatase family protein [Candidatus Woesearchaeota archaeon]|nr:histidine phosphatase family protein [Candidatus Woesearchaeota archaeon]
MSNNTLILLRHGQTKVDSILPIAQWVLTEAGEQISDLLKEVEYFQDVDIIICSTEPKSYQTIKPLLDKLGKNVIKYEEISELQRPGPLMGYGKYEETVKKTLENRGQSFEKWETANHALNRFSKKIEEIDGLFEGKKILIVGHAYTMNLYFAKLLNKLDDIHKRLETNKFSDYGIIKNGIVLKDIASL